MALSRGERIGPYEILSPLGTGGMGEVYRARDLSLSREVALKVLPAGVAGDPERRARFQREAEVLASLDHPNIGLIYGTAEAGNTRALALALIEGPTLAERIASGPLSAEHALGIARQMIEALEYAHDRGVVHRDLKPANIKVNAEGVTKVLDFGLAKVLEEEAPAARLENSPTLTLGHTRAGTILGTASYMSPEQAVGRPVDRRSDIFSFGSVLFEMLTGTKAFAGETTPDVLEAVVKGEPDWSRLPAGTPGVLERLMRRCLVKDRKQRLQAIGEARLMLDAPAMEPAAVATKRRWMAHAAWAAVAVAIAAATAGTVWSPWRSDPSAPAVVRFEVPAPEDTTLGDYFMPSPDGSKLVFTARGKDGINRLWLRPFDSPEARVLQGSEGVNDGAFWAPNSRSLAFGAGNRLKRMDLSGGPAQTIAEAGSIVHNGSWNRQGTILFTVNSGGILRVAEGGGTPVDATRRTQGEGVHRRPVFLPDGKHFLYQRSHPISSNGIYLASLDDDPSKPAPPALLKTPLTTDFAALDERSGRILFLQEGTLMSQGFDLKALKLVGDAVPVLEGVGGNTINPQFSVSEGGTLAYRTGGGVYLASKLTWFDRSGKATDANLPDLNEPGADLAFSPDASQLALTRGADIWLWNLTRGTSRQFTFHPRREGVPVWSGDSTQIAFASDRSGLTQIYVKPASGSAEETLFAKAESAQPTDWSRDGRFLLYTLQAKRGDIWLLQDGKTATELLGSPAAETQGRLSSDYRWLAYRSDEFGRDEIFVRAFHPPTADQPASVGAMFRVSANGGVRPRWRADGKELFFVDLSGNVMAVPVSAGAEWQPGAPVTLFRLAPVAPGQVPIAEPLPDGKRFLGRTPIGGKPREQSLHVVLNWTRLGPQ